MGEKDFKVNDVTMQEVMADEMEDMAKQCHSVLFNICVMFGLDWKKYCAALMRDLAELVEI